MTDPTLMQWIAAILFALALIHTFSTKIFERLTHTRPAHAGVWHLLGEVEIVFGFWAMVLIAVMFFVAGSEGTLAYIDSRNFTEPMFVFAIMVVAASKPVLQVAAAAVRGVARLLPLPNAMAMFFTVMFLVPLLGSLITEPAAMTVAALTLRDQFYSKKLSDRFKYAIIGVLFVNISIGGTLTPFAAPPILMVAGPWGWDVAFMITQIGWKAVIAVLVNAAAVTLLFRRELTQITLERANTDNSAPLLLILAHLGILLGIVVFLHHPPIFMGFFLLFMGIATAYPQYQERLILREGLLVAFFLAGLVVLGGQQQWWLEAVLMKMDADAIFWGATALTAITDNAALTYLGSLVEGLTDEFKYALVTGAVTGGGLTVIANAPNPAGMSILRHRFSDNTVNPLKLLISAIPPTLVAVAAFRLL